MANFSGDVLDAAADNAQSGKKCCVAIARDHLRADRFWCQTQLRADMLFHLRINIGKCTHGARDCARCNFGARDAQPLKVTIHFSVEARKGQAHRGRLCMDAMATPDADGHFMLVSAPLQGRKKRLNIRNQKICRAYQLDVETGVQHI